MQLWLFHREHGYLGKAVIAASEQPGPAVSVQLSLRHLVLWHLRAFLFATRTRHAGVGVAFFFFLICHRQSAHGVSCPWCLFLYTSSLVIRPYHIAASYGMSVSPSGSGVHVACGTCAGGVTRLAALDCRGQTVRLLTASPGLQMGHTYMPGCRAVSSTHLQHASVYIVHVSTSDRFILCSRRE